MSGVIANDGSMAVNFKVGRKKLARKIYTTYISIQIGRSKLDRAEQVFEGPFKHVSYTVRYGV